MKDLRLVPAGSALAWARRCVERGHYLHTAPDPRTRPFCYVVIVGGEPSGCLWFGRPEATRCYDGELTYGSTGDVQRGRARFDRWEVLNLARVWLSGDVQPGGSRHGPEHLPGFVDRKGVFRSTLASAVIKLALARIGLDYLVQHPPCFVDMPYQIRAVLSYCNRSLHRGVIYRESGFRLARTNAAGVETWWTGDVVPLTETEDQAVRELARIDPRSVRIRGEACLPT